MHRVCHDQRRPAGRCAQGSLPCKPGPVPSGTYVRYKAVADGTPKPARWRREDRPRRQVSSQSVCSPQNRAAMLQRTTGGTRRGSSTAIQEISSQYDWLKPPVHKEPKPDVQNPASFVTLNSTAWSSAKRRIRETPASVVMIQETHLWKTESIDAAVQESAAMG